MNSSKSRFRFTDEFDLYLAREVYGQNPYEDTKRWAVIQVNMMQITGKCLSIRTLKERMKNLLKEYLAKAESLKGLSGIEILVTEIDDLLQQISMLLSDYQKKLYSTTAQKKTITYKSSYLGGYNAREKACSTLNEANSENDIDVPQENYLQSETAQDIPPQEELESMQPIEEMSDFTNVIEIEIGNDNDQNLIGQEIENIPSPSIQNNRDVTTTKKKSSAQANILTPNRKRCNKNIKQTTVQYLEKKSERQYEIKCKELRLQERKQLLNEKQFEMERQERQKRLGIEEKRLEMEEKRLKVELELFANQQELIKILLKKES